MIVQWDLYKQFAEILLYQGQENLWVLSLVVAKEHATIPMNSNINDNFQDVTQ